MIGTYDYKSKTFGDNINTSVVAHAMLVIDEQGQKVFEKANRSAEAIPRMTSFGKGFFSYAKTEISGAQKRL